MLDFSVLLALIIALIFLSALLYISLGSRGVRLTRALAAVAELWLTVALFVAMSVLADRLLGQVPRGEVGNEIALRLAQVRAMPPSLQVLFIGGWALTFALLAHFMFALRRLQQGAVYTGPPPPEENDDVAHP